MTNIGPIQTTDFSNKANVLAQAKARGVTDRDNLVKVDTDNSQALIKDLEGALKHSGVVNFDGNIDTHEIYLTTDARVVAMSTADAQKLLTELKSQTPGFKLEKIQFLIGDPKTQFQSQGKVATAQNVLDQSNRGNRPGGQADPNQAYWNVMNGGATGLDAANSGVANVSGKLRNGSPVTKPAAWFNGIQVNNGRPQVYISPQSQATAPASPPMNSINDLRNFIQAELDFQGSFSQVAELAKETNREGKEIFLEAMQNAKPERFKGPGGENFKAILNEVYAYATTGMGVNGQTDIAQLQAILRAYDPEMNRTATTNTPFNGPAFNVGKLQLNAGDGTLGRATMLEMRHIGIDIRAKATAEVTVKTEFTPEPNKTSITVENLIKKNPNGDILINLDFSGSFENDMLAVAELFNPANDDNILNRYPGARVAIGDLSSRDNIGMLVNMSNDGAAIYQAILERPHGGTMYESGILATYHNLQPAFESSEGRQKMVFNITDEADRGAFRDITGNTLEAGEVSGIDALANRLNERGESVPVFFVHPHQLGTDMEVVSFNDIYAQEAQTRDFAEGVSQNLFGLEGVTNYAEASVPMSLGSRRFDLSERVISAATVKADIDGAKVSELITELNRCKSTADLGAWYSKHIDAPANSSNRDAKLDAMSNADKLALLTVLFKVSADPHLSKVPGKFMGEGPERLLKSLAKSMHAPDANILKEQILNQGQELRNLPDLALPR